MSETEKVADKRLATIADYKRTFDSPHGRRVLRRMMKEGGVMESSFVAGDSHGTAFNEGKRSAILDVCNRLKLDLKKFENQLTSVVPEDTDYIE